jgi:hypothetical protein
MENWLYRTKELWLLNKREIKRYGLCGLVVIAGFKESTPAAVLIGLGIALVMWAYDHWGRPWAERGRLAIQAKELQRKNP